MPIYAIAIDFEAIWVEMEARAGRGRPSLKHLHSIGQPAEKIVDVLEDFLARW